MKPGDGRGPGEIEEEPIMNGKAIFGVRSSLRGSNSIQGWVGSPGPFSKKETQLERN